MADTKQVDAGFVRDAQGNYFVQLPDDNQWGFSICDDDQTWPGGLGGPSSPWKLVDADEVPAADRDRLAWILDDFEQDGHSPWQRRKV
jgi:hypothetical protein